MRHLRGLLALAMVALWGGQAWGGVVEMRYYAEFVTSTTTSTSTSTSSSSTTSTTIVVSASNIYFPLEVTMPSGSTVDETNSGVADELRCVAFTAPQTITAATSVWWVAKESVSGVMGIAFYDLDGDPRLGSGTVSYTTSGTTYTVTLSPAVTLTAGTDYLMCFCSSIADGEYESIQSVSGSAWAARYANPFTQKRIGTGANSCSTGVPPTTTGTITADATYGPMWFGMGVP